MFGGGAAAGDPAAQAASKDKKELSIIPGLQYVNSSLYRSSVKNNYRPTLLRTLNVKMFVSEAKALAEKQMKDAMAMAQGKCSVS